ncbi:MAG: TonB-dependent receptor [Variibacter sp.]
MSHAFRRIRNNLLASVALTVVATATTPIVAGAQETAGQSTVRRGGDVLPTVRVRTRAAKPKRRAPRSGRAQVAPAAPPPPGMSGRPVNQGVATNDSDPYAQPAANSTIGATDIERSGGDVRETLRDVPGTFTRTNPQNPGVAVNIRGMEGSGRVNMMIDGVQQNFRFTGHEAQGFTYVDPELLAGVDIERGAVSTIGGGGLAGSANFRTLGIDDIIKPGNLWGAIGKLGWGNNGVGLNEMAAGALRISPNAAIGGAISHRYSTDYVNGDGVTVPGTGQDLISGLVKGDFKPTEDTKLALGAVFYNNDFFANSYWQTVQNNTYTAKFNYKPDNPLIDFRFNVSYNDLTMTYDPNRNAGSGRGRVIDDKGWGVNFANISRFYLGPVTVKAEYGFEYFHDDVKSINSATVANFGVNPSGESAKGAAFAQFTFSYGIFDLITAGRYGFWSAEGSGAVIANNPLGMPAGPYTVNRDEGHFSPKVTLAARVTDWLQPYVTYAETFRPPTISELLTGGTHPGTGGMSFFPNPFLEAEFSKGWEFGANIKSNAIWFADDFFRMKVDYFRNNVENYVTACFPTTGAGVFFCNNPGTSLVQGVEVQGEYDAGFAFAKLAYTHTHSDLPSQVNGFGATSYLPDHVLAVTIGGRALDRRLTVGARFSMVTEAKIGDINLAPGDLPYTPAYELVDLFASYKLLNYPDVVVGLTVTNLFDVAYTGALTTASSGPIFNGRGRTVLANIRAHF